MRQDIIGAAYRQCGDLNLVAMCMSLGIPLNRECPVKIIESSDGRDYGSYRIDDVSTDGKTLTDDIMGAWAGTITLPADHGFNHISNFIKARPRGTQKTPDLLDFAMDYLTQRGFAMVGITRIDDVAFFVERNPQSEAAYVLAYVWNRDLCFQLHSNASRQVYLEDGRGDDVRRALLDTRLPKWQAKEFLSRLQG